LKQERLDYMAAADYPNIWAEIDLGAISHNVRALKGLTRPGTRMMAVVKADAYGHGAEAVARAALAAGADMLAVARLDEGVALRQAGLEAPILILNPTFPDFAPRLIAHDLIQSVTGLADGRRLAAIATQRHTRIGVHLKVDTGMGRLGLVPDCGKPGTALPPVDEVVALTRLSGLQLQGIYTHFAAADEADKSYARMQLELFTDFLERLRRVGVDRGLRHAANSAALIDLPASHLDAVRPGIALYGLYPSAAVDHHRVDLQPAMSLKTRVLQVKTVPAGFSVSYGMTWQAAGPTSIATVAAGYADGLQRRLSNRGQMLVRGQRAPIVGRVCMDLIMLDVGHIEGVTAGDEVVIIGRQGRASISAEEVAGLLDTINYEVVFTNGFRVPRHYLAAPGRPR
jgi:alanine racemase